MKRILKTASVILIIVMILSAVPLQASAASVKVYGIDVSKWQGDINWTQVKSAGKSFAILRAGTSKGKDTYFEANYSGAKAAGVNLGVYYYTYALDVQTAAKEAETLLTWLDGKQFEYPIYIDMEDPSQLASGMTTAIRTNICMTFLDKLAAKGYYCGVYANKNWFTNYLDKAALEAKYTIWWAQYMNSGTDSSDKSADCDMWQYSSTGSVAGISGNVDLDVAYVDFPSIIKNGGYNNFGSDVPVVKNGIGYYKVTASALNIRDAAGTSGTRLTSMPNGTVVPVLEFNNDKTWGKVNYNGTIGWASLGYLSFVSDFTYTVTLNANDSSGKTQSVVLKIGDAFETAAFEPAAAGAKLMGFTALRMSDSKWLASDGTWVGENELGSLQPKLFSAGASYAVDDSWRNRSAGDDTFNLYALWSNCAHSSTYRTVTVQPDCYTTGVAEIRCSECDALISTEVLPVSHTFSEEFTQDTEPTYDALGSMSRHCLICGAKTDVTEIPALTAEIGDVNRDGKVSLRDVLVLRRAIAGIDTGVFDEKAADLNGDGKITMLDVNRLTRLLAQN